MALTFSQLFSPVVLPSAAAVLFTLPASPASGVLKNGRIRLTNTTNAAASATLYVDAAATASGPANCFLSGASIAPNNFLDLDIPTMKAGDTLRGFASAAAAITLFEMGGVAYS